MDYDMDYNEKKKDKSYGWKGIRPILKEVKLSFED